MAQPASIIMGIINITPDSFSDGGQFLATEYALNHAHQLLEQGANVLDIGGESTRPGAEPVGVQQELDRVIPVIEAIREQSDIAISIDTSKPQVMTAAVAAGASMINDVCALQSEGALEAAAQANVPVCIMHMAGDPKTMQQQAHYDDVLIEVIEFLNLRISECLKAGIAASDIIVDPGIGFGKTLAHNLLLLQNVAQIRAQTGSDVLIGVSRKSMINDLLGRSVEQRLHASVGLAVQAVLNGAKIVRVHDVLQTHDALRSVEAVLSANKSHPESNS